ncbi:MAG: hypothetical protein KBF37_02590 [Saprospiraceae bacterium]|nr:hypothetical protein [Saprospiraceae bacterium]MBP9209186.1 hypothetical protein [Saprospiraceae bacterium]
MKRYSSIRVHYDIPEADEFEPYVAEGIDHYFILQEEELEQDRQLVEKILESVQQKDGQNARVVGLKSGKRIRFCTNSAGAPQILLFIGLPFSALSFQGDLRLYEVYRLGNLSFAFVEALARKDASGYKQKVWQTLQLLYGIKTVPERPMKAS